MPALDEHLSQPRRVPYGAGLFWPGLWYAITFGSWMFSWGIERLDAASAAGLTALAISAELVSVAVRWNSIVSGNAAQAAQNAARMYPNKTAAEFAWLCAWGAQANALGFVAMLSPTLASMWPALVVTAALEFLLLPKSPWTWKTAAEATDRDGISASGTASASDRAASSELPSELSLELATAAEAVEDEHWTRCAYEGHTETGERFLGGWVRFQMAKDQKTLTLTVGFSPAFAEPPEVELDQELESDQAHCEATLEQVTPAGMRIAIKRSSTGVPLAAKLLWHAAQAEHAPAPLLVDRLP